MKEEFLIMLEYGNVRIFFIPCPLNKLMIMMPNLFP